MIVLSSTDDSIRLVSDQATGLDVHASYVDGLASIAPARADSLVTAAGTATIVGSPGSGVVRNVKTLYVRNRDTTPARIAVIHRKTGPVDAELIGCQLMPNASLRYDEGRGWRPNHGLSPSRRSGLMICQLPSVGQGGLAALREDVSNANATANTMSDAVGHGTILGFPACAGATYWFRFNVLYTVAATTTGARFGVYGPGSPTMITHRVTSGLSTTSQFYSEGRTTYDQAQIPATSAATGGNVATLEGFITPSTDGLVFLRLASEVSASAVTVLKGSMARWQRVL